MLTKEIFIKTLKAQKKFTEGLERMDHAISGKYGYSAGIWESDWCMAAEEILDLFFQSYLTEYGQDLVFDYIFRDWRGEITDSNTQEVIADIETPEDLWDYLESKKEEYFV